MASEQETLSFDEIQERVRQMVKNGKETNYQNFSPDELQQLMKQILTALTIAVTGENATFYFKHINVWVICFRPYGDRGLNSENGRVVHPPRHLEVTFESFLELVKLLHAKKVVNLSFNYFHRIPVIDNNLDKPYATVYHYDSDNAILNSVIQPMTKTHLQNDISRCVITSISISLLPPDE